MTVFSELFTELVRFEIELWNRLDAIQTAETGVSVAQAQALRAIASREGAARVQDVSADLQITVGAASKLIDRLERDGLAERATHPTDRRSMVIALTDSGQRSSVRAQAAADRALQVLLSNDLDESSAAQLTATLSTLRRSLTEGTLA